MKHHTIAYWSKHGKAGHKSAMKTAFAEKEPCQFCGGLFTVKNRALWRHERGCAANPQNIVAKAEPCWCGEAKPPKARACWRHSWRDERFAELDALIRLEERDAA